MYPSTSTRSGSIYKTIISSESTTLPTSTSPYLTQTYFVTTTKTILASFNDSNVTQEEKFKEIIYSSGYEQTLSENNMKLTELQFYIKNITSCIGIVNLISEIIKDHQWKTLIKCYTIFTSQLYTNHNNIQQASDLRQTSRAFYNPNPIFIPSYVSINQHTLWINL